MRTASMRALGIVAALSAQAAAQDLPLPELMAPEPDLLLPLPESLDAGSDARTEAPSARPTGPSPTEASVPTSADPTAGAPAVPPRAGEPAPGAPAPAEAISSRPAFEVAAKLALLLPAGKPADALAGADQRGDADRSLFAAGSLSLRYHLPWIERALGLALEGGYYRLFGEGARAFANDPDFGPQTRWSWTLDAFPIEVGLVYRLPLGLPVEISPGAGFAAVYVVTGATYNGPAGGSVTDAPQSGWALGFYVSAEAALPLGPGAVVGELRYVNARTDLGFQEIYAGSYNQEPGDVAGTHVLAGYRFAF